MTSPTELIARNARFAAEGFRTLSINPRGDLMINVGGRITPATLRTMAMLAKVSQAHRVPGPVRNWNLATGVVQSVVPPTALRPPTPA